MWIFEDVYAILLKTCQVMTVFSFFFFFFSKQNEINSNYHLLATYYVPRYFILFKSHVWLLCPLHIGGPQG